MANYQLRCKLCSKRILDHDKCTKCTICNSHWHEKCLPNYTREDFEYAKNIINSWTCPHCLIDLFPFTEIDSIASLSQAINNPINCAVDIDLLNNMIYDPFESLDNQEEGIFNDIDPDQNFLREIRGKAITNCKYYHSSNQLEEINENSQNYNIAMMHLNIRSIPKNLDTFLSTLHASNMKMDIITFTETWLKNGNASCYGIPGFSHEYLIRQDRAGGGVSIFIKDSWIYKVRNDLTHSSSDYELLWIEVDKESANTDSNLLIGTIYRRPGSNPADFNQILQTTLITISDEKKEIIHMGDYNLNLLNHLSNASINYTLLF
jgi:hypothetical protein